MGWLPESYTTGLEQTAMFYMWNFRARSVLNRKKDATKGKKTKQQKLTFENYVSNAVEVREDLSRNFFQSWVYQIWMCYKKTDEWVHVWDRDASQTGGRETHALLRWSRVAPSMRTLRLVTCCSQHARSSPGLALLPARTLFAWSSIAPSRCAFHLVTCCSQHAHSSPGHVLLPACPLFAWSLAARSMHALFAWSRAAPGMPILRLVTCCS